MTPPHVGIVVAFGRLVTKIAPAVDHLLRRPPADAELEPSTRYQISCSRVLDHIERVFVTHVDDGCANLNAASFRSHRREQGKRRSELPGKVVNPKVRSVRAQLLGGNGQLD